MISDLSVFFGRFHPLFVHLPIGFIIISAILEGYATIAKDKRKSFHLSIKISLLASVVSSVVAVILGLLLADKGGYDAETLSWHKWMGIFFTVLAFVLWLAKAGYLRMNRRIHSSLLVGAILAISITGHFGGNLTHGSDYLFAYAPEPIKNIFGKENTTDKNRGSLPQSLDSLVVYEHLIKPVLKDKCYSCHNATKAKGGLNLSTIAAIKEGSDEGPIVYGGESDDSSLFTLTILNPKDPKFMPPKGVALTYTEVKMVQWWINTGASFDKSIKDTDITEEMIALLKRDYDIDMEPKPYYMQHPIASIDSSVVSAMTDVGWAVKPLSSEVSYLQVSGKGKPINSTMLTALEMAKEHIIWLDLSNMDITDEALKTVGSLENLTQLLMNNSKISDTGMQQLQNLTHLEVLNIYNTPISDEGLQTLKSNSALRKIYIWQTNVTAIGIGDLKGNLPNLSVVGGNGD